MAGSIGLSHTDGAEITDWAHVEHSIMVILTTRIGQRVMRRDFGSELPELIDAPMTPRVVLALYSAVAVALNKWEPRYKLTKCEIDTAGADGVVALSLSGTYYPRGHLGDFEVSESKTTRLFLASNRASRIA